MSEDKPKIRLRVVNDKPSADAVVRLTGQGAERREVPVKIQHREWVQRLVPPEQEEFERRSQEPGIEAIIDQPVPILNEVERDWGEESAQGRSILWGWFVLIGLICVGAALWSITNLVGNHKQVEEMHREAVTVLEDQKKEDADASRVVDSLDQALRGYLAATSVDGMLPWVRHPHRVRPLMEEYYKSKPPEARGFVRLLVFMPVDHAGDEIYWLAHVEMTNGKACNLMAQQTADDRMLIDWETDVCYQPVDWEQYVSARPPDSLSFRITAFPDNLYSHEFMKSGEWSCYRLTVAGRDSFLFGYTRRGSEEDRALAQIAGQRGSAGAAVILRLSVPTGLESPRGVVIEKLLSDCWLYPDSMAGGS
jgi:hypothetical protein